MKLAPIAAIVVAFASPAFAQAAGNQSTGNQAGGSMQGMSMQGMDQGAMVMADGEGVVKAIDPNAGSVTIQHGPIAALKWPAMTMTFKASNPALLQNVSAGQSVRFKLMQMGGEVTLTAIAPK